MTELILIYLAGCLATYLLLCKFIEEDGTWEWLLWVIVAILFSWVSFIIFLLIIIHFFFEGLKFKIKLPKPPKIFSDSKTKINNKQCQNLQYPADNFTKDYPQSQE